MSDTLDPGTIASIVALIVSLVALIATTLQVLQQYFASATGYSNCSKEVMGLWTNTKRRKFRLSELRFEVLFEAPVIFVAPPTNKKGPVDGVAIWYMDGSDTSYRETRTMKPEAEKNALKASREGIHTADNERASWVTMLSALQKMEMESRLWEKDTLMKAGPRAIVPYQATMAIAVQSKKRSWDSMPNVKKPYATTTISHLIEMAALLEIYWQVFDRKSDHYRAEGNGYILSGSVINNLGIVFAFEVIRPLKFDNRVVPLDEVKELCFGFVPTIFRTGTGCIDGPLAINKGGIDTLQLGSKHEIAETLVLIGCDTDTVNYFLKDGGETSHLFPIAFEILGMLGKTLRIRGSCFRKLPNPTIFYWKKKSFSLPQLLAAFHERIKKEQSTTEIGTILRFLERVHEESKDPENSASPKLLDALHDAIHEADEYLTRRHVPQTFVLDVLWRHLQAVLSEINKKDSQIEKLNRTRPVDKEYKFIQIYFDIIRDSVINPKESHPPPLRPNPNDAPPQGIIRSATGIGLDDHRNIIWCTLMMRMLCWLLLHDFSGKDCQIPRSELLGSRLPVYII